MKLEEKIRCVANYREKIANLKTARDSSYQQWQRDNEVLLKNLVEVAAGLEEEEKILREMALAEYAVTENKKPAPGLEIKIFQEIRYDPAAALVWAKQHDLALRLDEKAFEKIANASPLDFVEIAQIAKCQIATDLSTHIDTPPSFQEREACKSQNDLK